MHFIYICVYVYNCIHVNLHIKPILHFTLKILFSPQKQTNKQTKKTHQKTKRNPFTYLLSKNTLREINDCRKCTNIY